ncbi:Endoribonuclease Dicer [Entomortierella chlamydospora]|nr:Endoribonuclease Dicer [Entomortierella chlamydospora]
MKRQADQDTISPNTRHPRLSPDQDDTLAEDTIIIDEGEIWEQRKKAILKLGTRSPDLYVCFLSAISLVRRHFSETDDVKTKTGLKFKGVFDSDSEKWECHLSHPSSTTTFESGPFARQDHAICWVAFVACRELRLDFPSIGLTMEGQPANACADDLAVRTFLCRSSPPASRVMQFVKTTVACAYYRGGFYLALAVASGVIGPMEGIDAWGDFALPGAVKGRFTYERLEFLGDAVLDILAAFYFLGRNQQISEGDLCKDVSDSTNNAALGALCLESKYYGHSRHRGLEKHIIDGEQAFLTKKRQACYWTRLLIPKVCFANIIESAFRAVFLDSGFDLEAVGYVFDKIACPFLDSDFPCV